MQAEKTRHERRWDRHRARRRFRRRLLRHAGSAMTGFIFITVVLVIAAVLMKRGR